MLSQIIYQDINRTNHSNDLISCKRFTSYSIVRTNNFRWRNIYVWPEIVLNYNENFLFFFLFFPFFFFFKFCCCSFFCSSNKNICFSVLRFVSLIFYSIFFGVLRYPLYVDSDYTAISSFFFFFSVKHKTFFPFAHIVHIGCNARKQLNLFGGSYTYHTSIRFNNVLFFI